MKKIFLLFSLCFVLIACNQKPSQVEASAKAVANDIQIESAQNFGIVIHGGAGNIIKGYMSDSLEQAYRNKLEEAVRTGHEVLAKGGTAVEAVQRTIIIMEDSPLFNAGKGAVFNNEETNELDASIMDGKTLNAGAVAGVTTIKNPINLAYEVMVNSKHVMLSGEGAERFAKQQDVEIVDPKYFYTERRFQSLQHIKSREKAQLNQNEPQTPLLNIHSTKVEFGTVGCAALDKNGNLAAGTSTGGMSNKKWGRIGDSPIIGAGTYANNNTCAVSGTGWGEFFIRSVAAYDISALMEYKGLSLEEAAREVIQKKIPDLGGDGGIVAIDHKGNIAMEFNTPGMFRANMNKNGEMEIGIYGKD